MPQEAALDGENPSEAALGDEALDAAYRDRLLGRDGDLLDVLFVVCPALSVVRSSPGISGRGPLHLGHDPSQNRGLTLSAHKRLIAA